jgi:excisionase family DNA binding protein
MSSGDAAGAGPTGAVGSAVRPAPLMSLAEVAQYLGVSKRWLYEQARTGKLRAFLIARTYRFRQSDVDDFAEEFRVNRDSESS